MSAPLAGVRVLDLTRLLPGNYAATKTSNDGRAFYRVYDLIDGQAAVAAIEPQFWAGVCDVLGEHDLKDAQWDDDRKDEAVERLTARFASMTREGLIKLIDGRDCCINVVNTYEQMFESPHAVAAASKCCPRMGSWKRRSRCCWARKSSPSAGRRDER